MTAKTVAAALVAAAGFLGATGCGPKGPEYAEVSGKVTYKGATVNAGQIYFKVVGTDLSGFAELKDGGVYSSGSVPVGKCKVMIKTKAYNPKPNDTKGPPSSAGRSGGSSNPASAGAKSSGGGSSVPGVRVPEFVSKTNPNEPHAGKYVATPEKYDSETTTTLEFDVVRGKNTFDVDLKD